MKYTNSIKIINTETFTDNAKIVSIFGQGCSYETKKGVAGFEVQFDIEATNEKGETKKFHIVFQSSDRLDNIKAYSGYEMSFACLYGCDADEAEELDNFMNGYDEIACAEMEESAEAMCLEYLDSNV